MHQDWIGSICVGRLGQLLDSTISLGMPESNQNVQLDQSFVLVQSKYRASRVRSNGFKSMVEETLEGRVNQIG